MRVRFRSGCDPPLTFQPGEKGVSGLDGVDDPFIAGVDQHPAIVGSMKDAVIFRKSATQARIHRAGGSNSAPLPRMVEEVMENVAHALFFAAQLQHLRDAGRSEVATLCSVPRCRFASNTSISQASEGTS